MLLVQVALETCYAQITSRFIYFVYGPHTKVVSRLSFENLDKSLTGIRHGI